MSEAKVCRIKKCTRCKEIFPATEEHFHKSSTGRGGLNCYCKTCACIKAAESPPKRRGDKTHRRYKALEKGFCWHCDTPRLPNHNWHCLRHWVGTLSSNAAGTTKFAPQLIELAETQQWRCALTGDVLTPAVNMSLDHKYAKATHPHLQSELSNLQWVTLEANLAKRQLSVDEFVAMCRKVAATADAVGFSTKE